MLPPYALKIDIYVTGATSAILQVAQDPVPEDLSPPEIDKNEEVELTPPMPLFAHDEGRRRRPMSGDSTTSYNAANRRSNLPSYYMEANEDDDIDLTNYEDEETESPSAMTIRFSMQLVDEGKKRRARTKTKDRKRASYWNDSSLVDDDHENESDDGSYFNKTPSDLDRNSIFSEVTSMTHRPQTDDIPPVPPIPKHLSHRSVIAPTPTPGSLQVPTEAVSRPTSPTSRLTPRPSPNHLRRNVSSPAPPESQETKGAGTVYPNRPAYPPRPAFGSHRGSKVLLELSGTGINDDTSDEGLWMDVQDYTSMVALSELAKPGRPDFAEILQEEIARTEGSIGVGSEYKCLSPGKTIAYAFIMT